MSIADWLFPWRARKRILFLERCIPKDPVHLQAALDHEKQEHAATRDRLARQDAEYQRMKAASAALAVWIQEAFKLKNVQATKEVKNLLR